MSNDDARAQWSAMRRWYAARRLTEIAAELRIVTDDVEDVGFAPASCVALGDAVRSVRTVAHDLGMAAEGTRP